MESSETPASDAETSTSQIDDGPTENTGEVTLKVTFHSNGQLSLASEGYVGMFHLWTAAKFLEHKGNEIYTQAQIQQMQAQDKLQVVRSLPRDHRAPTRRQ